MHIVARQSRPIENLEEIAERLWLDIISSAHVDAYEIDSIFDRLKYELGLVIRTSKNSEVRAMDPRAILIDALNRLFARRRLAFDYRRFVCILPSAKEAPKAAPRL